VTEATSTGESFRSAVKTSDSGFLRIQAPPYLNRAAYWSLYVQCYRSPDNKREKSGIKMEPRERDGEKGRKKQGRIKCRATYIYIYTYIHTYIHKHMYMHFYQNIYIHICILVCPYRGRVYNSCVTIFSVPLNSMAGAGVNSIRIWILLTASVVKNLLGNRNISDTTWNSTGKGIST
jgi:hypothetical protein